MTDTTVTHVKQLRRTLERIRKAETTATATERAQAALALAEWEATNDWETVPKEIHGIIMRMGRRESPAPGA